MKQNNVNRKFVLYSSGVIVHCSRSPFLLWSISLRRAKGGFFSVGFSVVGAVGGGVYRL